METDAAMLADRDHYYRGVVARRSRCSCGWESSKRFYDAYSTAQQAEARDTWRAHAMKEWEKEANG
jgi:hypothetical protein